MHSLCPKEGGGRGQMNSKVQCGGRKKEAFEVIGMSFGDVIGCREDGDVYVMAPTLVTHSSLYLNGPFICGWEDLIHDEWW